MKPTTLSAVAAGATAAVAIPILLTLGVAQADPAPGTLKLIQLQKENHSTFVDNPPKAKESAGDVFTVAGKVRDPDRTPAGRLSGAFTQTAKWAAQGSVTFQLSGGTIEVVGALSAGDVSTLAIAGGTGDYASASGTLRLDSSGHNKTIFVFDFS